MSRQDLGDDHWRTAQDLSAMEHQVVLKIRQRRRWCRHCQRRFYEPFDSVDVQQRQTNRLQAQLLSLARGSSLQAAAQHSSVSYRILHYLYFKWVRKPPEERPLPRRIGIDEFALRKGHRYATVITGLTRAYVWGLVPERTQATLEGLLKRPGACLERVKEVVIDMWEPFFLAVKSGLPKARIVIARFHVERHLYDAVDACRKRLSGRQKKHPLKEARKLFLTPVEKLTAEQKQQRQTLLEAYPELARAVHLAERFHRWYSRLSSREQANKQLSYWLRELRTAGIPELQAFAQMVKRWRRYIVNYFLSRSTNGRSEGFNTKIKLLKRLSYGRLCFEHLAARILRECGFSP
jgi:transposase